MRSPLCVLTQLWAVLEDCGVFPPDTATHRDLAVAIAGLVRLADTTAFAAHSAHPPLEALLARNPQIPARWETAGEVPQPEQVAAAAAAAAVRAVRSGATAGAVTEQTHVQGTNTTTTSEETIYEEYEGAARTALWHSLLSAENVSVARMHPCTHDMYGQHRIFTSGTWTAM